MKLDGCKQVNVKTNDGQPSEATKASSVRLNQQFLLKFPGFKYDCAPITLINWEIPKTSWWLYCWLRKRNDSIS